MKFHKARLMTRGFLQVQGVDCFKTYALVVKFTSIHIILAFVTFVSLFLFEMDVETPFLSGYLEEKVCMEQMEQPE